MFAFQEMMRGINKPWGWVGGGVLEVSRDDKKGYPGKACIFLKQDNSPNLELTFEGRAWLIMSKMTG